MDVFVQVPIYDESPGRIDAFAESIQSCRKWTREDDDIRVEAWVTPATATPKKDISLGVADTSPAFDDAYVAPEGKLRTRNVAHDHALASDADVIVTWDVDAPAIEDDVLAAVLAQLRDDTVVGAQAEAITDLNRIDGYLASMYGVLHNAAVSIEERTRPHMNGQMSAFMAEAWRYAGPFDTDLDQTDVTTVREEEEFRFRNRLEQYGNVTTVNARVHNDPRRSICRLPSPLDGIVGTEEDFCSRRGTETFTTRGRR